MAPRLLALLGLLLLASGAHAQVRNAPKTPPRKEDIPFIRCQVCEQLAKAAWKQGRELLKKSTPAKKVTEMDLIELMERVTTSWRDEGSWITRLDVVESGDKLVLKDMDQEGECGEECKTIERAAEEIMGEHDTDLAEAIFTGKKNRAQLTNWLCYELSTACKKKPPPVPKGRAPGPPFTPRSADSQNVDKMIGELGDKGLRGSMFSREEILERYGLGGADVDGEEEEEVEAPGAAGAAADLLSGAVAGGKAAFAKAKDLASGVGQQASEGLSAAVGEAKALWNKFAAEQKAQGVDVPEAEL